MSTASLRCTPQRHRIVRPRSSCRSFVQNCPRCRTPGREDTDNHQQLNPPTSRETKSTEAQHPSAHAPPQDRASRLTGRPQLVGKWSMSSESSLAQKSWQHPSALRVCISHPQARQSGQPAYTPSSQTAYTHTSNPPSTEYSKQTYLEETWPKWLVLVNLTNPRVSPACMHLSPLTLRRAVEE